MDSESAAEDEGQRPSRWPEGDVGVICYQLRRDERQEGERTDGNRQHRPNRPSVSRKAEEDERPDEIKLLLNCQTPQVPVVGAPLDAYRVEKRRKILCVS